MSFYSADGPKRAATLKGLRELVDFLDAHPDVPVPTRMELQLSTYGPTMDERAASVDQFAQGVGTRPEWSDGNGNAYYTATRAFGPVRFFCVAIDRTKDES